MIRLRDIEMRFGDVVALRLPSLDIESGERLAVRGHNGSVVLGVGEEFTGYDFVAERPQVHHERDLKSERIEVGKVDNSSKTHLKNFADSAIAGDPSKVNCSPELGAAAVGACELFRPRALVSDTAVAAELAAVLAESGVAVVRP